MATSMFAVDATGKKTPIKWTKGQHAPTLNPPEKNSLVIGGFTDRGFVQSKHTENKPVWIKHYPKAVIGDLALAAKVRLSEHVPLELVPVLADGKLRFQALWNGKPLRARDSRPTMPVFPSARNCCFWSRPMVANGARPIIRKPAR